MLRCSKPPRIPPEFVSAFASACPMGRRRSSHRFTRCEKRQDAQQQVRSGAGHGAGISQAGTSNKGWQCDLQGTRMTGLFSGSGMRSKHRTGYTSRSTRLGKTHHLLRTWRGKNGTPPAVHLGLGTEVVPPPVHSPWHRAWPEVPSVKTGPHGAEPLQTPVPPNNNAPSRIRNGSLVRFTVQKVRAARARHAERPDDGPLLRCTTPSTEFGRRCAFLGTRLDKQ